jgi:phosphomannomutase
VFLIDEQAVPMSGSTTTALVARAVLATNPGATVIYNLICSKAVPEVIAESGGVPLRSRVGHSFIKATMAETGAIFGGEHSGHYYFRDNYRADSGLIAALIVLEQLSLTDEPLSEIRKSLERYADSGEINVEVADPQGVIDRVAAAYPQGEQDRTDGLTVEFDDWWFNLRPSNTEPVLRINVEAESVNACDDHTQELVELVSQGA